MKECLRQWNSTRERFASALGLSGSLSKFPLFRDEYPLRISRAANPTDILWENLHVEGHHRSWASLRTYGIMALIFLISSVFTVGAKALERRSGNAWYVRALPMVVLLSSNITITLFAKNIVRLERLPTRTAEDTSIMVKLTLGMILNYTVLPLVTNWDVGEDWYSKGGLLNDIFLLLIANALALPLLSFLDLAGKIRRFRANSIDITNRPNMTQAELNKLYEMPAPAIPRAFAVTLKMFVATVVYLPMMPLGALFAFGGLTLQDRALRLQLLRRSRRSYRQSHEVAESALRFVYHSAWVSSIAALLFVGPSLRGRGARTVNDVAVLGVVSVGLALAAKLVGDKVLEKVGLLGLFVPDLADTASDADYYVAQMGWPKHDKYHTSHPVYLMMERIMVATKTPFLWNPADGNLNDPKHKVRGDLVKRRTGPLPIVGKGDEIVEGALIEELDPTAMAVEDLKKKIPLETRRAAASASASASASVAAAPAPMASDVERGVELRPGLRARIDGLVSAEAQRFNGTECTLLTLDPSHAKWVVQLAGGGKANVPPHCLAPIFDVGARVRVGTSRGSGSTSTELAAAEATVLGWDSSSKLWAVVLDTGRKAMVSAEELEAVREE